ncbi:MAG: hypothetical protein OIF54_15505 [Cohaesibacter sp.]|nr:hypothetical protein [Cohaesibacter sp.]
MSRCPVQRRQACDEEPGEENRENPFEMFAETEILAEDCLGHQSQSLNLAEPCGAWFREIEAL